MVCEATCACTPAPDSLRATRHHEFRKIGFDFAEEFAANCVTRKNARSASNALLLGRIYDDAGNRMTPTASHKEAVRYRFYLSSAHTYDARRTVGLARACRPSRSKPPSSYSWKQQREKFDCYSWNGQTLATLSAVAKAITGSSWNGYVFFGLKAKSSKSVRADG